jgi:hypothetical protein
MVRTEYIRCLQRLYKAANNSDNENKPTWMRGDECAVHCNALEKILEDMGVPGNDPDWLEVLPEPIPLSEEEKERFGVMLQQTWEAIASDAIQACPETGEDVELIIEMTIDANRPEMFGYMSSPEYQRLLEVTRLDDTKAWLRKVLNY